MKTFQIYKSRNLRVHQIVVSEGKFWLRGVRAVGSKKNSEVYISEKVTCKNCLREMAKIEKI